MVAIRNIRVPLGKLVATPGVLEAITESGQSPLDFLCRHIRGDWGNVCSDDGQANDDAIEEGLRLLSAYTTAKGVKLWIITECDRSVTTILLPDEY